MIEKQANRDKLTEAVKIDLGPINFVSAWDMHFPCIPATRIRTGLAHSRASRGLIQRVVGPFSAVSCPSVSPVVVRLGSSSAQPALVHSLGGETGCFAGLQR